MSRRRGLWLALGFACVGLGALGLVLPILPATPFLIVAAASFARSSQRLHSWLLSSPSFGAIIRNWEAHRCIPRATKIVAIVTMGVVGSSSVVLVLESTAARVATLLLLATGLVTVLLIPTCPAKTPTPAGVPRRFDVD